MPDSGEMKRYDELLELLAEEQSRSKGTPATNYTERREYRRERIRELLSPVHSTGETKSFHEKAG